MNNNTEKNNKSVKAEITVVFKTCDLMDSTELSDKYNGNIKNAVKELIKRYSLFDLVEEKYVINSINVLE